MSCTTTTSAPFFGCCFAEDLVGLVDSCLVRFFCESQSGGIPFDGMRSNTGYYPAGNLFAQYTAVMNSVIERAVFEVNAMEFPTSTDVALVRVADLRHPSPILPPLPCVRFTSGSDLALYDGGVGDATPFGLADFAGSFWSRPGNFSQTVTAYKVRLRFNRETEACVFQYVQCSLIPIAQEPFATSLEHVIPAYGFNIFTERAGVCPNQFSYRVQKQLEPGACP